MEDAENNEIDPTGLPTTEKREIFLRVLSETCNVTRAAEKSKLDRSDLYKWKKDDEVFSERWDAAKELGVEALEDEMHRRAVHGVTKVNKYGVYREYSDTLAIFLAKAHKPEKFSERIRNEITGAGGAPLNLDDHKIAAKLDAILKTAQSRRTSAEAEQPDEDDFDDLC